MDRNVDYGAYADNSDMYKDPMFNLVMQYEQACMYYKYLTAQMDYKIKCKEYDKLCRNDSKVERRVD